MTSSELVEALEEDVAQLDAQRLVPFADDVRRAVVHLDQRLLTRLRSINQSINIKQSRNTQTRVQF